MGLEQKLNLKLQQKLVMTPTLQQAIKLLQLSRLELEQEMTHEVEVNPLLEMTDDAQDDPGLGETDPQVALSGEGGSDGQERGASDGEGDAGSTAELPEGEPLSYGEVELESLFANYLHDSPTVASTWEDDEDGPLANTAGAEVGLFEALCGQLRLRRVDPELAPIAEFVVGNLDPDGYLRVPEDEIAAQLGVAGDVVGAAIGVVQALDPPGVGARSLRECFELQLDRLLEGGHDEDVTSARAVVAACFDDLLHQQWDRVTAVTGFGRDELVRIVDVLRRLNPHPGALIGPAENLAVEPDLVARKVDGEWRVMLQDDGLPRLRVSPRYLSMLQSRGLDGEARGYLRERMRSALWFLRSVEQRQNTILKVGQAIVRRQEEFLERGIGQLRPLVLRDIADDIGMHESTVSRVVSNKYMNTPRGVFPLKYFFHSAISHALDGDISSVVVKERIKDLIGQEDAARPLSDARIARQLNRLGIRIARRTVAKYREEVGIPSSEQRRRALR